MSDLRTVLQRPRVKRASLIAGGLYAFYVIFGFFGVPRIIKGALQGIVAETLDRPITLERARFNPFLLATTLEGLRIEDDQGEALLELGSMRSNNQFFPILLGRLSVARFELSDTTLRVARFEDGATNIDRLLALATGKEDETEEGKDALLFHLYVGEVDIANVSIEVVDEARSHPLRETLGPISFVASDIRTDPGKEGTYAFDSHFGETGRFSWEGTIGLNPIGSKGSFGIENLDMSRGKPFWHDFLDADITGSYSMSGDYRANASDAGMVAELTDGSVSIVAFDLKDAASATQFQWEGIAVDSIDAQYPEMKIRIGAVALDAPKGTLVRNERGEIELPLRASAPGPESSTANPQPPSNGQAGGAPASVPEQAVEALVKRLTVTDGHFAVIDEAIAPEPAATMEAFEAEISNLAPFSESEEADVFLSFSPNGSGTAQVKATALVAAESLEGNFELEGFELMSLQAVASGFLNASIDGGAASLRSSFKADLKTMTFVVDAEGSIAHIAISESASEAPVFAADAVGFSGARFADEALSIDRIEVAAPIATLALLENGLNVTALMKESGSLEAGEETVEEESESGTAEDEVLDFPIAANIGVIQVSDGQVSVEDRTLEELHRASFRDFAFKAEGLSTEGDGNAVLSMSGNFDGGGAFSMGGELNPLNFKGSSALELSLNGFDLSATGPYWKKYLGRALDKGMLNVAATFKIEESQLDGATDVMVDQLRLGEKVQSEDSLGLPVGLAVAILQDRKGVIELPPLKLTGDLSDPSASVSGIVMKALGNIIVKIATSPFAMFGGGAGGEKDLSEAVFGGGAFALDAPLQERLDRLAGILEDRPGLKLDISSLVAQETEANVFKRILIANRNEEASAGGVDTEAQSAPVDPLALLQGFDRSKYEEAAKRSYRDLIAFASELVESERTEGGNFLGNLTTALKPVVGLEDDSDFPAFAEIEKKLFSESDIEVDLSWLNRLADEREKNVKDYLIQAKGIDLSRVFISGDNQIDASVSASSVQFELTD